MLELVLFSMVNTYQTSSLVIVIFCILYGDLVIVIVVLLRKLLVKV